MLGLAGAPRLEMPNPDGTIAAADRQQFLYGYAGIAWDEPTGPTLATITASWEVPTSTGRWQVPSTAASWEVPTSTGRWEA